MDAVLITNVDFPFGSAWSSRARSFVMLFCTCGYHVHVIAPHPQTPQNKESLNGFDYSLEYVKYKDTILTLCGIGSATPFCNALTSYLKAHKVAFVFSNRLPFASEHIASVVHSFGAPYILEQCEWFDPSSFKGGTLNPYYRKSDYLIRKSSFRFADGIVAISRLFETHYSSLPVIRIPTILDVQQIESSIVKSDENNFRLIFTGNISGKKELLTPVFEAISKLSSSDMVLHFDIYGPNIGQVMENISGNKELWEKVSDVVTVHGRIPQQKNEEKLREADFSIFIRPDRLSSNAGFPTKLAESMAVGTPVISNNTGDVGVYLNSTNGFLLQDNSSDTLLAAFKTLFSKSKEEIQDMRLSARETAQKCFDYRNYLEPFKQFITSVKEKQIK